MEKMGVDLSDDSPTSDTKQPSTVADKAEATKLSIEMCLKTLIHTCQCRDVNCPQMSCQKMKRILQHTKICKRKTNGGCIICKQLLALCCYHAKTCEVHGHEKRCPVPFCFVIKHKLKQANLQQRLREAKLLCRRMTVTCSRTTVPTGSRVGNSVPAESGDQNPANTVISPPNPNIFGGIQSTITSNVTLETGIQAPSANPVQVEKEKPEEAAPQETRAANLYEMLTAMGVLDAQAQAVSAPSMQNPNERMGTGPDVPVKVWRVTGFSSKPRPQLNSELGQTNPQMMQAQQMDFQGLPQLQQELDKLSLDSMDQSNNEQ